MAKLRVEDCRRLPISAFRGSLWPAASGGLRWMTGNRETGSVGFQMLGNKTVTGVRLMYTSILQTGQQIEADYVVGLTTSAMPRGGIRYWFACPVPGCARRVACLYAPGNGRIFGCRQGYDLAYESQQTRNTLRRFYRSLNANRSRESLDHARDLKGLLIDDPYEGYLTAPELCDASGLAAADLLKLADAHLLLEDTEDGRYRPKLVSWGRKLAHLLQRGWQIEEISAWARGRWKTEDPRKWPPDRARWIR